MEKGGERKMGVEFIKKMENEGWKFEGVFGVPSFTGRGPRVEGEILDSTGWRKYEENAEIEDGVDNWEILRFTKDGETKEYVRVETIEGREVVLEKVGDDYKLVFYT